MLPSASAGFVAANCRNQNRTRDCQLPAVDFILPFPSALGIPSAFSFRNWQLQLMNAARRSTCNDTRNADQKRRKKTYFEAPESGIACRYHSLWKSQCRLGSQKVGSASERPNATLYQPDAAMPPNKRSKRLKAGSRMDSRTDIIGLCLSLLSTD
ncbi:hypothetical protein FA13DRAFT_1119030 [Coprinellus micaceus]|uniref:Uncharacterized protein n=1 Tax=Coprinellus micaceus TaxID=71717 RepID=A0A4Y7RKB6_COPMI|nr:hypothetical protein FA13DRAFT_1119030 [Coprinellus micaceus]